MTTPTVAEVMTTDVVSVHPTTSFKQVAELLAEHEVSAVPVVDTARKPVGVVSEADLLVKEGQRGVPQGRATLLVGPKRWRRWTKSAATRAGEVMHRGVATIDAGAPLSLAARRLTDEGLRRLFVVDEDGHLAGVIARRDVMRVFLKTDEELRAAVEQEVLRRVLWVTPEEVQVHVVNGEVTLSGEVERLSEVEIAGRLTARIPGVVTVHNRLTHAFDDSTVEARR